MDEDSNATSAPPTAFSFDMHETRDCPSPADPNQLLTPDSEWFRAQRQKTASQAPASPRIGLFVSEYRDENSSSSLADGSAPDAGRQTPATKLSLQLRSANLLKSPSPPSSPPVSRRSNPKRSASSSDISSPRLPSSLRRSASTSSRVHPRSREEDSFVIRKRKSSAGCGGNTAQRPKLVRSLTCHLERSVSSPASRSMPLPFEPFATLLEAAAYHPSNDAQSVPNTPVESTVPFDFASLADESSRDSTREQRRSHLTPRSRALGRRRSRTTSVSMSVGLYRARSATPGTMRGLGHSPSTFDEHRPALPLAVPSEPSVPRISHETVASLLDGKPFEGITKFVIIDCRYPFEYDHGHIKGALNLFTYEAIEEYFLLDPAHSLQDGHRVAAIFHCEFSSQRGPALFSHLRNLDRHINLNAYPQLLYPETYILDGGYKRFFEHVPHHCTPQHYKRMDDEAHADDCVHFRRKVKQSKQDTSTWQHKRKIVETIGEQASVALAARQLNSSPLTPDDS